MDHEHVRTFYYLSSGVWLICNQFCHNFCTQLSSTRSEGLDSIQHTRWSYTPPAAVAYALTYNRRTLSPLPFVYANCSKRHKIIKQGPRTFHSCVGPKTRSHHRDNTSCIKVVVRRSGAKVSGSNATWKRKDEPPWYFDRSWVVP